MGKSLKDRSTAALLLLVLSGGCDGNPGVSEAAAAEYAKGLEEELLRKKKRRWWEFFSA